MTIENPTCDTPNTTKPPIKLRIGDTAASCSNNNDDSGMFDVEVIDKKRLMF